MLDLGCRDGSFPVDLYDLRVVRVDLEKPTGPCRAFVQADAARLPFPSGCFDAVILNHSIEHFAALKPALQEIGRVVRNGGALYAAVPNARTFSDRLYRKLFRNAGGHVNLFDSSAALAAMLSWYSHLAPAGVTTLYSGFSFWNRANLRAVDRTMLRVPALPGPLLALLAASTRWCDALFGTRASQYGWALYFGSVPLPVESDGLRNVCVRCGAGHEEPLLRARARKLAFLRWYRCPACGAGNILCRDSPAR